MKTDKFNWLLSVSITFLSFITLLSCEKDELVKPPKVILTTDWTNRTEGVDIPSDYTVTINNQSLLFRTVTDTLPELEAGTYAVTVYNSADKVTINGFTATVATSGNVVDAWPGYLFYSALDAVYENEKDNNLIAVMQQQMRLLNIELTITEGDIDNIESITASLSGVANSLDMKTGTYSGTELKVIPVFIRNSNKLIASVRLIGLTSETQNLTLDITYKSGTDQEIVSDVSSMLANFEADKYRPLTLKGNAEVFTAIETQTTIESWDIQDTINGNTTIN